VALRSNRILVSLLSGSVFAAWTPIYLRSPALQSVPMIEIISIMIGYPGYFAATLLTENTSPSVWLISLADFVCYSLLAYGVLTVCAAYKKQSSENNGAKSPKSPV